MPAKAKAKKATINQPQTDAPKEVARPQWPLFQPLAAIDDLGIISLARDQIVTIPTFWTAALCKKYVAFLSTLPLSTTPGKPKRGDAVRVNDRFQIDDPAFATRLWQETSLKALVQHGDIDGHALSREQRERLWGGEVVGLNPNIRIYRYTKGQFFDQHYDDSNNVQHIDTTVVPHYITTAKTTWTLLLYLTSSATGCQGGETVFYPDTAVRSKGPAPEPISVALQTGMALLHRHGKDCMLHEGREVLEGEKWVIRSDLCVKR